MRQVNRPKEESGPGAPAYIVTFTTLVALLLAFFVVLVSMGHVRDDTLLDEGEGGGWSFLESFQAGFRGERNLGPGATSYYYSIENPEDDAEGRTLDVSTERVRRDLKKVVSHGAAAPSPINAEKVNFALTDIHFAGDEKVINEQSEHFLKEFCIKLRQDESPSEVKLCVLCISGSGQARKKGLFLAAQRAKVIEDFLRANLPDTGKWSMYSWAAGPDSVWTAGDKVVAAQPRVLIAILRNGS